MRVIRTGIDFQFAVHRRAHLRLGQHAVHGILDKLFRLPLPHETRAFLAQAALVAAMLALNLLIFLAAGELHLGRVHHDDVIAGIDERGIRCLVLAL